MKVRIRNVTRNTELGDKIEIADTAPKRRTGLLKHSGLAAGEGLWIVPCESVHTFSMNFPIDIIYLDRTRVVLKVRYAVKPWRMSASLTAHSVIELPSGTARESGTARGDQLEIELLQN